MAPTSSAPPRRTPQQDCESLNEALKGKAGDIDRQVVEILSNRDATQLQDIKKEYSTKYPKELSAHLSEKLSSEDLKRALSLWTLNEAQRDATIVRDGLKQQTLDLVAVTEVIYFQTPSQLLNLEEAYSPKDKSQLVKDIEKIKDIGVEGCHGLQELLRACVEAKRKLHEKMKRKLHEKMNVDLAKADAKQLHNDKSKGKGVIKKTLIIDIFTKGSRAHLAAVAAEYKTLSGQSLREVVQNLHKEKKITLFETGLLILLRCATNPARYFAEVLHKAMNSNFIPRPVRLIIRVVVTRAHIDMKEIKKEYEKEYKVSLNAAIKMYTAEKNKTSDHCRTFLLNLVK